MPPSEHAYHRSVAPMMWMFFVIACMELLVTHFLVSLWDWRIALALSLVTLAGIVWLGRVIASFRRLPVLVGEGDVLMRAGRLRSLRVPLDAIAEVRTQWVRGEAKARETLDFALLAYPNVMVELRAPLAGRRGVRRVTHRFDDPVAFHAALLAAVEARVTRASAA